MYLIKIYKLPLYRAVGKTMNMYMMIGHTLNSTSNHVTVEAQLFTNSNKKAELAQKLKFLGKIKFFKYSTLEF